MALEPTSARPERLEEFDEKSAAIRADLAETARSLTQSYRSFNSNTDYPVRSRAIAGDSSLKALAKDLGEIGRFARLVARALHRADRSKGASVLTAGTGALLSLMKHEAGGAAGFLDLMTAETVMHHSSIIATVPHNSSFVNDPVATASGFLVVDFDDLASAISPGGLGWRRVYASGKASRVGAHGPGWTTWADARLDRTEEGLRRLRTPDGAIITFYDGEDGWWTEDEPGLSLREAGRAVEVAWPRGSRFPGERWAFRAGGTLATVQRPDREAISFSYLRNGSLKSFGRSKQDTTTVDWESGRIVALRTANDVAVSYSYDEAGRLIRAAGPGGRFRYEYDVDNHIVEQIDADDVVLARNTYDANDRVLQQSTPDGRSVAFSYTDPGTTSVTDEARGAITNFTHDRLGRTTRVRASDGTKLTREFDEEGFVKEIAFAGVTTSIVTERASDGSDVVEVRTGDEVVETFAHDLHGRLTEYAEPDTTGLAVEYRTDGDSSTGAPKALVLDADLRWDFDWDHGQLARVQDPDGVEVAMETDADRRTTRIVVGGSAFAEIERDEAGRPTVRRDARGGESHTAYDDAGRVVTTSNALGAEWRAWYTAAGRLAATETPLAERTEYEYDDCGRLTSVTGPTGSRRTFRWLDDDRPTELSINGVTWRYEWSDRGQITSLRLPDDTSWTYSYDAACRVASVVAPGGGVTVYEHDDRDRLTSLTDPLGFVTQIEWGAANRVDAVVDSGGAHTEYRYDSAGRLVSIIDADLVAFNQKWTRGGRLAERQEGHRRSRWIYDERGRVASYQLGELLWTYHWDDRNVLIAVEDPGHRVVRSENDALGLPTRVSDGTRTWTISRDEVGRVLEQTDAERGSVQVEYDADGAVVATTDPLGGRTTLARDLGGRVKAVVDAVGSRTALEYDERGRCVSRTDQLGRRVLLEYDPDSNLIGRAWPDGSDERLIRDQAGRTVELRGGDLPVFTIDRDMSGRVLRTLEPGGREYRFEYTPAGRCSSWSDGAHTLEWAAQGTGTPETSIDGVSIVDELDDAGAVVVTLAGGHRIEIARDQAGRIVEVAGPDFHRRLEYDEAGAVLEESFGDSEATRFEHDLMSRIVSQNDQVGTTRFRYDAAGQLVGVEDGPGSSRYHYDPVGRLIREDTPAGSRVFEYDVAHQLRRVEGPDGATEYEYDVFGRRVSEVGPNGTRLFEWNAGGSLTAVVDDDVRHETEVDAFGLPRKIGNTELVWDVSTAQPRLVKLGHDIVVHVSGQPGVLLDPDGGLQWFRRPCAGLDRREGDVWGGGGGRDQIDPELGWRGGVCFLGLVWFGARVYDPATRSFLSPDPALTFSIHPCAQNPYHFASNDPINVVDPTGMTAVLSVEDLNDLRADATGVQWGNVASIVVVVALTLAVAPLALTGGAAIAAAAAIGATGGVAQELGDAADGDRPVSPSKLVGNAVLGGVSGSIGGGTSHAIAGHLTGSSAVVATVAADGAVSGGTSVIQQGVPLSQVDWGEVAISGGVGMVTSAGAQGIQAAHRPIISNQGVASAIQRPPVNTTQSFTPLPARPSVPVNLGGTVLVGPGWSQLPSGLVVPSTVVR